MGRLAAFSTHFECAVCGDRKKPGETWFVITEDYWEDRLRVWKWNQQLASNGMARCACGQRHVRELVVHWMITGCLHYPFASVPLGWSQDKEGPHTSLSCDEENDERRMQLGELAVDRVGIVRVLNDNPLSLNSVLDELMIALENEAAEESESEHEDGAVAAWRTV